MNRISEEDLNTILENTCKIFREDFVRGSNIFITGATGFFGKWLLESFVFLNRKLNLNSNVFVLSRDPESFLKKYKFYEGEKNIFWIKGDIRTFEFPSQEIDYIIHAATDADATLNNDSPLLMLDTITEGTRRVLKFAQNQPELKAFLLTSSGAVYGKQPENVDRIRENDSFYIDINHPNSAYSEGKRLAELYCSIYAEHYKIPVKIARCFAFVGPYLPLDRHFAIGNFIRDGLESHNITIKGDGSPLRSYMYAADLTIWLWTILLKGDTGDVYNVGSDKAISIKELAMMIARYFPGISVDILNQTHPTDRNQNYVPDVTKFKRKFNLSPKINLEEAILKSISFNKEVIK